MRMWTATCAAVMVTLWRHCEAVCDPKVEEKFEPKSIKEPLGFDSRKFALAYSLPDSKQEDMHHGCSCLTEEFKKDDTGYTIDVETVCIKRQAQIKYSKHLTEKEEKEEEEEKYKLTITTNPEISTIVDGKEIMDAKDEPSKNPGEVQILFNNEYVLAYRICEKRRAATELFVNTEKIGTNNLQENIDLAKQTLGDAGVMTSEMKHIHHVLANCNLFTVRNDVKHDDPKDIH